MRRHNKLCATNKTSNESTNSTDRSHSRRKLSAGWDNRVCKTCNIYSLTSYHEPLPYCRLKSSNSKPKRNSASTFHQNKSQLSTLCKNNTKYLHFYYQVTKSALAKQMFFGLVFDGFFNRQRFLHTSNPHLFFLKIRTTQLQHQNLLFINSCAIP